MFACFGSPDRSPPPNSRPDVLVSSLGEDDLIPRRRELPWVRLDAAIQRRDVRDFEVTTISFGGVEPIRPNYCVLASGAIRQAVQPLLT